MIVLLGCAHPDEMSTWPDAAVDTGVEVVGDRGVEAPPDAAFDAAVEPPDAAALDVGLADVGAVDATVDLDAGEPDADPSDAAPDEPDEGALDAMVEPEPDASWGPCSVRGAPGDCLPTALCDGDRESVPGFCPGPRDIQCCVSLDAPEPDPEPEPETEPEPEPEPGDACDPDVHVQPNQDLVEPPGEGGCPRGMIPIADFCIDRVEASLLEIEPDGAERPWSPYQHPGDAEIRAVAIPGAVPQGYIDGIRAERACVASGKRLCTDVEWLRACRGVDEWQYPYGPDREDGRCNDARARHPAVELFPDAANPFAHIQDACINQLPESLDPAGSNPGCVTPEGAFDLMGNLHEWTADPTGTFRGGFYVDTVRNGPGCLYRTTAHNRFHWDYSTGFRCCADR